MTDRKTAAELRATAEAATGYDRMVLLHLAAVEEEREAAMDPTARPCRDCGNDGTKLGCNEAACACGHMCIMHMTGGACRADDCPCTRFAVLRCDHSGIGEPGCRVCDARMGRRTVREHARNRGALSGAEAQALEGALSQCERDLVGARNRIEEGNKAVREALNAGPDESTVGAAKRVVQGRDDWKARHDQVFAEADRKIDELRRAVKNADAFAHAMAAKAGAAERLAADALRIGLEECERLRAELVKLATERSLLDAARDELRAGRAQLESARAALKGDREKVGEWWEVWCETGVVDVYRQRASAQRWARVDGDRLVHVTRWRKKR